MTGIRNSTLTLAVCALTGAIPILGWLVQPVSLSTAVVLRSIAIVGAFHGFGRLVGSLAGDDDAPLGLTLVWGLAVYLGLAGLLMSLQCFGAAARAGVITAGCLLGAGWLSHNALRIADDIRARITPWMFVVAVFSVILAAIFIIGAAGHWHGPFFDADVDYLGAIRRLVDTGGLDDAVAFPRTAGLGGQVALAALVDTIDPRTSHLVERGILFVITGTLVIGVVRRLHGVGFGLIALTLLVLAIPQAPDDMAPRWSLVVLILGSGLTLDRALKRQSVGAALLVVLTASATMTLRHAAAVFALALILWLARASRSWRAPLRWRPAVLVVAAMVLPLLVSMARAWAGPVDTTLGAQIATAALPRILICTGFGAGAALLFAAAVPIAGNGEPVRVTLLAACASAADAGVLSPSMAAAWEYLLPLAIASVLLVCIVVVGEPSDDDTPEERPSLTRVILATTFIAGALALGRFPAGKLATWPKRFEAVINDARALGDIPRADRSQAARDYAVAQQSVPAGARLGIWVERPDLVDYRTHSIVDLRTPRTRPCGTEAPRASPSPACSSMPRLVLALRLRYILVSSDAAPIGLGATPDFEGSPVVVVDLFAGT